VPSDWAEALKLAGRGFGATILVLLAMAIVTGLVGLVLQKLALRKGKGGDTEEGDA